MAYIFHHDELAPSIDKLLRRTNTHSFMERINIECLRVQPDMSTDKRLPVFLKCLSDERVNHVLRTILGHNDPASRAKRMNSLTHDQIQELTVPYDDKTCSIDGEELHVVYSIAPLDSPFRKGIVGPHGVHLYEKDAPHFGLIYVYCSEHTEQEDGNGDYVGQHTWLPIKTPPERIIEVMRSTDTDQLLKGMY